MAFFVRYCNMDVTLWDTIPRSTPCSTLPLICFVSCTDLLFLALFLQLLSLYSTLFLSSFFTLHVDITLSSPLPHPTLGLLFPLLCLCPSFPLSYATLFCLAVIFCLFFCSLSPLSFCHMLFSSGLLCFMPVGLRLWMLHVLLCVSRAHCLLLLQLCWRMAPLTLRSAAVMVI